MAMRMGKRIELGAGRGRGLLSRAGAMLAFMLVAAMAAALPLAGAHAQISGTVVGATKINYGRMVFTFAHMPKYEVRVSTGVLVLSFDEAVNVEVKKLPDQLKAYIGAARLDPDGKAVRFALLQKVRINAMEAGERLFLDFLPEGWTGLPPGLPKEVVDELVARAKQADQKVREKTLREAGLLDVPPVKVAVGRHPTFSRISFLWDRQVAASLTREGNEVTVRFDARGVAELDGLKGQPLRFVREVEQEFADAGLIIRLTIDRSASVRAFNEDNAYVIDVAGGADALAREAAIDQLIGEAGTPSAAGEDAVIELVGEPEPETPGPAGAAGPAAQPDAVTSRIGPFNVEAMVPRDFADWTDWGFAVDTTKPSQDTDKDEQSPGREQAARSWDRTARSAHADEEAAGRDVRAKVHAARIGRNVRLTFTFAEPVAAAVFDRAGTLWMVFDSDQPIDLGTVPEQFSERLRDVQLIRRGDMQFVRLRLAAPALTTAAAEDGRWVVTIGELVLDPPRLLALRRSFGPNGQPLVTVNMADAGKVRWIEDPDLGSELAVVTAFGPVRGLGKAQDFVQFKALSSAHGLAFQPVADDIRVGIDGADINVSRGGGLWLSEGSGHDLAFGRGGEGEERRPGFVDFAGIRDAGPAKFLVARQQLEELAAMAEDNLRVAEQLTLARFYVGNELAAEALGVLNHLVEHNPEVADDPIFNATRGIANVLMHRPAEARKDLAVPGLSQSRDIVLWRGLAAAELGLWEEAWRDLREGEGMIGAYPYDLQVRFRLAAARAALELNRPIEAHQQWETVQPSVVEADLAAELQFVHGRILEAVGRGDDALLVYQRAITSEVRPVAAAATLRQVALQRKLGRLDIDATIDALDALTVSWRGDDIELEARRMLAQLHVEKGDHRRAFEMVRMAVFADRNSDVTRAIQDEMSKVFLDLFLSEKSESMAPIDALSLYYDYRDLTPIGRSGDALIRKLAERLISVDLLDQAAELLTYQIDHRLQGAGRAQVAVRLAFVHLLNHKPALALGVIERTRTAQLPRTVQRQRNLLEARALAETGRTELALEMLEVLEGEEIPKIRADALWRGRKWQEAAEQLERNLADIWAGKAPLEADHRFDVMRAAIAYSLAEDQLGLARLRKKFAGKMSDGPDAHAFEVVTNPLATQGEEFNRLAKGIAAYDSLDAFLTEFRQKYSDFDKVEAGDSSPPS